MPCETSEELPTCPICLGEPEVIRTSQCGHVICLACALRLRQQAAQTKTAAKCPVCSKGVRLEDLRPVRLEPQHLPKPEECHEGLRFTLVRRTGMHYLSLASEMLPSNYRPHLPLEGEPGALFARRIFGDVELYLSALHEDLHTLEAIAAQGSEEAALLEPALKMLRARLAEDFKGAEGLKESDDGGAEQLVFYQSSDGQLIFLEPHLMKRLLASYSTWGRLPPSVLLKPLKSMRQEALTDEMKKRHRFLLHLPSDAAGNLISFADGEVVAGDELKSGKGGRKGEKSRRSKRRDVDRDHAWQPRDRLESHESKASTSFSGAEVGTVGSSGLGGPSPFASPVLAPKSSPEGTQAPAEEVNKKEAQGAWSGEAQDAWSGDETCDQNLQGSADA